MDNTPAKQENTATSLRDPASEWPQHALTDDLLLTIACNCACHLPTAVAAPRAMPSLPCIQVTALQAHAAWTAHTKALSAQTLSVSKGCPHTFGVLHILLHFQGHLDLSLSLLQLVEFALPPTNDICHLGHKALVNPAQRMQASKAGIEGVDRCKPSVWKAMCWLGTGL